MRLKIRSHVNEYTSIGFSLIAVALRERTVCHHMQFRFHRNDTVLIDMLGICC